MKAKTQNTSKLLSLVSCISTVLALSACGSGGGGSTPTKLTGKFIDNGVSGLQYKTATQEGLTNAAGEFEYLAGESVSFSIGGIELGSATGASQINPFDLIGIAPLTTEEEILPLLNDYKNINDIDRVSNIASLLVFFDNDRNPDNGIDLSGWNEKLSADTLSLESPFWNFVATYEFENLAKKHGLDNGRNTTLGLDYLYKALGIKVAVKFKSKQQDDNDNDGSINAVSNYTYNDQGAITSYTSDSNNDGTYKVIRNISYNESGYRLSSEDKYDDNEDGIIDEIYQVENTYSENNTLIKSIRKYDSNGADGNPESINTETYNESERILSRLEERDTNSDGVPDYTRNYTYSYNENGKQILIVNENFTGLVLTKKELTSSVYDSNGNRVSRKREIDSNGDGIVNQVKEDIFTFDANNQLLTYVYLNDSDGDGLSNNTSETTYSYNAKGLVTSRMVKNDADADGIFDSTTNEVSTYNANNRRLSRITENDDNIDGIIDSKYISSYSYDSNENILVESRESYNAGLLSSKTVYTYTYNDIGFRITSKYQRDSDGNGLFETTRTTNNTYDANGFVSESKTEEDTDGDGSIDKSNQYNRTNDSLGNVLNSLITRDNDGDGSDDEINYIINEYITVPDGLSQMLRNRQT